MQPILQHPRRAIALALLAGAALLTPAVVQQAAATTPGGAAIASAAGVATTPTVVQTPGTVTTTTVDVHATLSHDGGDVGEQPVWTNLRVSIVRNGVQVENQLALPDGSTTSYYQAPKLLDIDIDDDGEPEVLIDVFTVGDDCCGHSVIYRHDASGYHPTVVPWGTSGYKLTPIAHTHSLEFVTTDPRLPAGYGSTARGPVRVLAYRAGTLVDITASTPALLLKDARLQKRAWRRADVVDPRPALAAYLVDLLRLGMRKKARAALTTASKRKELRGVSAAAFARSIDRRAIQLGYYVRPRLS